MPRKYTSEQFWKLYEKLPEELKDALFAEETGNNIFEICRKNEIGDDLDQIVEYVGQVLVGVLAPEDFQKTLEKELNIGKDDAKKITQEINRFIFYPVRPALEQLYKVGTAPAEEVIPSEKIEEEKPKEPPKKDIYRELIE